MNLFYCPDLSQNLCQLSEEESSHAVRVLRMKNEDRLQLTDGKGRIAEGVIFNAHPKHCEIKLTEEPKLTPKHDYSLHLAIGPVKNFDRFEWFLEKAVELGIDEISPVICANSERDKLNMERCRKVLLSAMKQSMNLHLPLLNEPISFKNFLDKEHLQYNWIAHCKEGEKFVLYNLAQLGKNHLVLIGPEGDFTKEEIEKCLEKNFKALNLGSRRLRTETAAVFVCAALKTYFGT